MFKMSRRSPFLVALFVLVVLLNACSRKKPEEDAPRAEPNRGLKPVPAEQAEPKEAPQPAAQPFRFPEDTQQPTAAAPAAEDQPAAAAPEGPPPRDYSGELKGLVGTPSGCLKPRVGAQAPREISVTVEAVVMESGMVSRAYARAADLDDDELSCIRARLTSARMGGGVEDAPRTVTTNVSLVLQPAATRVPADQQPGGEGTAPSEPAAQPPGEGQQPEPGAAAPSGAEQAPPEQPSEAPPPAYGQPEAPANNPE